MTYDPRLHHRRSIRLRGYDYAGGGAYFVTICTQDKKCLFGEIAEGNLILTEAGSIVQRIWDTLPQRFGPLVLDVSQIMPNHLHAIFVLPGPGLEAALAVATGTPVIQPSAADFVGRLHGNEARGPDSAANRTEGRASPPPTSRRISMGDVVGAFKSISTIALNKFMSRPGAHPLHENFYEHIIRDTRELEIIRDYIVHNPQRWLEDPENPNVP